MTALTDQIAREHGVAWISGSGRHERVGCACGARSEQTDDAPMLASHARHVAEVTEAAVRAQIAADVEAQMLGPDSGRLHDGRDAPDAAQRHAYDEGLDVAASIARTSPAP